MLISQKCQYALRAVYHLAGMSGRGPVRIADIAQAQAIPPRFLELILGQLKHSGFVSSRRGSAGGYYLTRAPQDLTVGEVIRFVQGPTGVVGCMTDDAPTDCALKGDCVFQPMWEGVRDAISEVYDHTTFAGLLEIERRKRKAYIPAYSI